MRTSGRLLLGVWLALTLLPGGAWALGFGDIQLKSALNAPLEAEIEFSATAEELAGLRASLASSEQFASHGVGYPSFLDGATVQVGKTTDGRNVLQVRTTDAVSDPFLTLLVQITHTRGVLMREYAVLLDPPVFAAQSAAAVSAPTVGAQARAGELARRDASGPSSAATAADSLAVAPSSGLPLETYRVRSGDTLSSIAVARYPHVNRDSALLGIYRANTHAFEGNMNALRRDSLLSLPAEGELVRMAPAEARAEVGRQYRAWADEHGSGRLRLVAPSEVATPSASPPPSVLQQRIADLEQELAEKDRLLSVSNAQLAQLQQRAGASSSAASSVAQPPAPAATPSSSGAQSAVSWLGWLQRNVYVPLTGVALLAAGTLVWRSRRTREEAFGEASFEPFAADGASVEPTPILRPLPIPAVDARASVAPVAGGSTVPVDQTDPLAEADFLIAYGLYDQAADLVIQAMGREPGRRELRLKLLEVYFVGGNKPKFERLAADLAASREGAAPDEWEKVVLMGRQISPQDPLFAVTGAMSAVAGSIDLNLEGGRHRVDLDLLGDTSVATFDPSRLDRGGEIDEPSGAAEPIPLGTLDSRAEIRAAPRADSSANGSAGHRGPIDRAGDFSLRDFGHEIRTAGRPAAAASLTDFDAVTMSEVGTKLDLARAYVDMGDPEGARSILEQVLSEGSESQQQEARRLIQSLAD